jgi:hypothetical protein
MLQENIREIFQDQGTGNDFQKRTPVVQEIIAITNKWDCIKLKCCCTAMKQPTE